MDHVVQPAVGGRPTALRTRGRSRVGGGGAAHSPWPVALQCFRKLHLRRIRPAETADRPRGARRGGVRASIRGAGGGVARGGADVLARHARRTVPGPVRRASRHAPELLLIYPNF
eukprot:6274162-Prymnesium_polylepis.1